MPHTEGNPVGGSGVDHPQAINTNLGIHGPETALTTSKMLDGEPDC